MSYINESIADTNQDYNLKKLLYAIKVSLRGHHYQLRELLESPTKEEEWILRLRAEKEKTRDFKLQWMSELGKKPKTSK
jgi:hypothetical protein